jgi:hypothetical protein
MTEKNSKEKEIAEQKAKQREVALETIKSGLWNYALPQFVTTEQFGKISELAKIKYQETLSKTPEQSIYEKLFLPALSDNTKSLNSHYIQETSSRILQESLLSIKIEDVMKYVNSEKTINKNYQGKYVADIKDDKVKLKIISSAISYTISDKIKELLGDSNKANISELEKIVCEVPKSENKEQKKAA